MHDACVKRGRGTWSRILRELAVAVGSCSSGRRRRSRDPRRSIDELGSPASEDHMRSQSRTISVVRRSRPETWKRGTSSMRRSSTALDDLERERPQLVPGRGEVPKRRARRRSGTRCRRPGVGRSGTAVQPLPFRIWMTFPGSTATPSSAPGTRIEGLEDQALQRGEPGGDVLVQRRRDLRDG